MSDPSSIILVATDNDNYLCSAIAVLRSLVDKKRKVVLIYDISLSQCLAGIELPAGIETIIIENDTELSNNSWFPIGWLKFYYRYCKALYSLYKKLSPGTKKYFSKFSITKLSHSLYDMVKLSSVFIDEYGK